MDTPTSIDRDAIRARVEAKLAEDLERAQADRDRLKGELPTRQKEHDKVWERYYKFCAKHSADKPLTDDEKKLADLAQAASAVLFRHVDALASYERRVAFLQTPDELQRRIEVAEQLAGLRARKRQEGTHEPRVTQTIHVETAAPDAPPEHREVIERILRLRAEQKPYTAIVEELNTDGVKPFKGGKQWYVGTVRGVCLKFGETRS